MKSTFKNILIHSLYGILIGVIGGFICGLLGQGVKLATDIRNENLWLIYLLPIAGVFIVLIYKLLKVDPAYKANKVIETIINRDDGISINIVPAILIATIITHLFGGPVGKESAGILIGYSIACMIARKVKAGNSDIRIIAICGTAAGFSALFGTPITAAIFSLEIINSEVRTTALIPSLISAYIGKYSASLIYANNEKYILNNVPSYSLDSFFKVLLIVILVSVLSILMIYSLEKTSELFKKIKNEYIRIMIGGIIVTCLLIIFGKDIYAGAGLNIIEKTIEGEAFNYAFLIKIILTSIALAAGYKGGEIVPTLFIGSTFGSVIGPMFGVDAGFAAGLSMICLFASNTNCPIAAIALAYELFGINGILFFVPACIISYILTSNNGLYINTKSLVYRGKQVENKAIKH